MSRYSTYRELIDVPRLVWDPDEQATADTRTIYNVVTYEQHHTGAGGPTSLSFEHKRRWLLAIERMHEMKLWSDIFYHLFVFADGEVWEGRNVLRTSQGNINSALTVHIPGNNVPVTEAQHASLLRIARWATSDPFQVRDHQQRPAATFCSGDTGREEILRLRIELDMDPLEPIDRSDHPDAVSAKALGLWSGTEGGRAASRSVAAITAFRAYRFARRDAVQKVQTQIKAWKERTSSNTTLLAALNARVASIENRATDHLELGAVVSAVLDELQERLEE